MTFHIEDTIGSLDAMSELSVFQPPVTFRVVYYYDEGRLSELVFIMWSGVH